MNQPATPNSLIEGFPPLPTPEVRISDSDASGIQSYFSVEQVQQLILADRSQRPSSLAPTVAAWPTNDEVYAEVCRERGKLNFYVSTNAVNDVMAAVRRLAPAAPSGEAVGEVVLFGGDCKEVAWAKGKMPAPGTKLYTRPAPSSPTAPGQQAQAVPEGEQKP